MALLLAMYQKMKLIREKNQAQYDLTRFSSKYDRVTKNIERVQKRYTSLFAKLESQAKMMQSQATMQLQNMTGLGVNSVNLNNINGTNQFVYQTAAGLLEQQGWQNYKTVDGKQEPDGSPVKLNGAEFQQYFTEWQQYGKFRQATDENGQLKYIDADKKVPEYTGGFEADKVAAFTAAMQQAQVQQERARMWVQNTSQNYGNQVSIWLEASKAQLEAEQDAVLEPLHYQETMWELEKTQTEAKLERIKQNLESYQNLLQEESQNAAPKFGLG